MKFATWLFFVCFSASMCINHQTTSGTERTVWRCSIPLLFSVSCKQPLARWSVVMLTHTASTWRHLFSLSFQVSWQQRFRVLGKRGGDCLSEGSRYTRIQSFQAKHLKYYEVFFITNVRLCRRKFLGSSEFTNAVFGLFKWTCDQNGSRGRKAVVWLSKPCSYCQPQHFNTRGENVWLDSSVLVYKYACTLRLILIV